MSARGNKVIMGPSVDLFRIGGLAKANMERE